MYVCIERGLFNIHISNTIYRYSHTTFVCVFYLCGIAIQHSCFIVIHNSTPIFQNPVFNFFNSTLRIDNSTSIFISNTIHMRHFVCVFYLNLCSIECLVCVCCGAECDMLATQSSTFLFGHWTFLFPCRPFSRACLRILRLMSGVRRPDWRVRRPDWRHHTILTSHKPILLEGPRKENACSLAFTLQESNHREPFPRRGPGTFTLRVVPCCH